VGAVSSSGRRLVNEVISGPWICFNFSYHEGMQFYGIYNDAQPKTQWPRFVASHAFLRCLSRITSFLRLAPSHTHVDASAFGSARQDAPARRDEPRPPSSTCSCQCSNDVFSILVCVSLLSSLFPLSFILQLTSNSFASNPLLAQPSYHPFSSASWSLYFHPCCAILWDIITSYILASARGSKLPTLTIAFKVS
jgi:hypothetical protein